MISGLEQEKQWAIVVQLEKKGGGSDFDFFLFWKRCLGLISLVDFMHLPPTLSGSPVAWSPTKYTQRPAICHTANPNMQLSSCST